MLHFGVGWGLYYVYIVECRDGTYYTGIATDVDRRIEEHNAGKGAKYTRGRGPVKLLVSSAIMGRGRAQELESWLKSIPRINKVQALTEFCQLRDASGDGLFGLEEFNEAIGRLHAIRDEEVSPDATSPGVKAPKG